MHDSNLNQQEAVLKAAVLRGDETAWESLYRQNAQGLKSFIRIKTTTNCDEIVQEVWMIAVRKIRQFDPSRGTMQAWLRGIAQHVLRNHYRKKSTAQKTNVEFDATSRTSAFESRDMILATYSVLPGEYQSVLQAKYEQRQTVAEIATAWGKSQKAIESLLTRARNAFRKTYEELESQNDEIDR